MGKTEARLRYAIGLLGLLKLLLPPFIKIPILNQNFDNSLSSVAGTLGAQLTFAPNSVIQQEPVLSLTSITFIFWLTTAIIFLSFVLWRAVRFQIQTKNARFLKQIKHSGKTVNLYECENISIPMTFGLTSKRIYVPLLWHKWSSDCHQLIISHEVAHIRRFDGLVQTLQIFVQAIYLFHPLIWLLNRQLNALREMACDDVSTGKKRNSSLLYTKCLVEIAESMVQTSLSTPSASTLIRCKNFLFKRVKYQLEEDKMTNQFQKALFFIILLFVFSLTSVTFTQVNTEQKQEQAGETIEISIKNDSKIIVQGKTIKISGLEQKLNEIISIDPQNNIVKLTIDKTVPMSLVNDVHTALRNVSLLKVIHILTIDEGSIISLTKKGEEDKLQKIPKKNRCDIMINKTGMLMVDGEIMTKIQMQKHVENRLENNPNLIVDLLPTPTTRIQDYIVLLDDLKAAGAKRLSIGAQKPPTPPPPPKAKRKRS